VVPEGRDLGDARAVQLVLAALEHHLHLEAVQRNHLPSKLRSKTFDRWTIWSILIWIVIILV
jgi:hypothetical protein